MLSHELFVNPFGAGTDFKRHNLTSNVDRRNGVKYYNHDNGEDI